MTFTQVISIYFISLSFDAVISSYTNASLTFLVVAMSTSASLTEEKQINRSKQLVLRPLPLSCVLFWGFILN